MAAKVAIAIRQAEAMELVQAAVRTLTARFGLAAVDLTPQQRDPDLARACQLEAVATLLAELVDKTAPQPVKVKPVVRGGSDETKF